MSTEPEKRSDEETWAKLADSATPGPWHWENNQRELHGIGGDENYTYEDDVLLVEHDGGCACRQACTMTVEIKDADRDFIAAAREAVPALLAALAASRADNERQNREVVHFRDRAADALRREAAARVEVSQLRAALREIRSIGARSGTNLNAWNDAFKVFDRLAAEPLGSTPSLSAYPPVVCPIDGCSYTHPVNASDDERAQFVAGQIIDAHWIKAHGTRRVPFADRKFRPTLGSTEDPPAEREAK